MTDSNNPDNPNNPGSVMSRAARILLKATNGKGARHANCTDDHMRLVMQLDEPIDNPVAVVRSVLQQLGMPEEQAAQVAVSKKTAFNQTVFYQTEEVPINRLNLIVAQAIDVAEPDPQGHPRIAQSQGTGGVIKL